MPEWENILVNVLRDSGLDIMDDEYIRSASFEYEPDSNERTNFNFYLVPGSGKRISFEVKYTESEFGGISPATSSGFFCCWAD